MIVTYMILWLFSIEKSVKWTLHLIWGYFFYLFNIYYIYILLRNIYIYIYIYIYIFTFTHIVKYWACYTFVMWKDVLMDVFAIIQEFDIIFGHICVLKAYLLCHCRKKTIW